MLNNKSEINSNMRFIIYFISLNSINFWWFLNNCIIIYGEYSVLGHDTYTYLVIFYELDRDLHT